MNKKLKQALKNFDLHVTGATVRQEAWNCYNRKRVHANADIWADDVVQIKENIKNYDELKTCIEHIASAMEEQISQNDYMAAKFLAMVVYPLVSHSCSWKSLSNYIDSRARDNGKDPYNQRYINFYELNEAYTRFYHKHRALFNMGGDLAFFTRNHPSYPPGKWVLTKSSRTGIFPRLR